MSETKIPERIILKCDRCDGEGEKHKSGVFEHGGFHIRGGEDWSGKTFGHRSESVDLDLCRTCSEKFDGFLSERGGK